MLSVGDDWYNSSTAVQNKCYIDTCMWVNINIFDKSKNSALMVNNALSIFYLYYYSFLPLKRPHPSVLFAQTPILFLWYEWDSVFRLFLPDVCIFASARINKNMTLIQPLFSIRSIPFFPLSAFAAYERIASTIARNREKNVCCSLKLYSDLKKIARKKQRIADGEWEVKRKNHEKS